MSKTIEIIIDVNGNSRVETKGFTGTDCLQASRFLEQALGDRTSEELTSEYHQARSTSAPVVRQSSP